MVDCSDEKIQAALESRAVLNLVKRHMRDENIEMVDEGDEPALDPNELRMRVTDQVVYEVVDAVKRHAGTA